MFDLDSFIADCLLAVKQPEPTKAVKKLVQAAIAEPDTLKAAVTGKSRGGSLRDAILFRSDALTVLTRNHIPGVAYTRPRSPDVGGHRSVRR